MPARDVIARLRLLGQAEFTKGMTQAAEATAAVGTEAAATSKKARSGTASLIKWSLATAAVYKGYHFLKESVTTTTALAKSTAALQRTTGLDAETASAWVMVAKERGIAVTALNRSFLTLGKNMTAGGLADEKARQRLALLNDQLARLRSEPVLGSAALLAHQNRIAALQARIEAASQAAGAGAAAFKQLGLSQAQLATLPAEKRIEAVAQALLTVRDPMERAALGQKLLGRAYLQLAPLLARGADGIAEFQEAVRKSGATLSEDGVKRGLAMIKTQRELDMTMEGVSVTLAQALLPLLKGLAGNLQVALDRARPLLKVMSDHSGVVLAVAGALVGLVAATKAYNLAMKTFEMVTKVATALQWLLNFALDANPIALIVLAVVALGVELVLLYQKHKGFRDFVLGIFHAMKTAFGGVVHFLTRVIWLAGKALGLVKEVRSSGSNLNYSGLDLAKDVAGMVGLASGGTIMRAGQVLVGEKGPEILSLPSGATVSPINTPAVVARGPGGGAQTLVTKVYLDKRQIALAVAEVNSDRRARR